MGFKTIIERKTVAEILLQLDFNPTGNIEKGYDVFYNEKRKLNAYLGSSYIEVETQPIAFPFRFSELATIDELKRFLTLDNPEYGWCFPE